jgi:hypothetical protein
MLAQRSIRSSYCPDRPDAAPDPNDRPRPLETSMSWHEHLLLIASVDEHRLLRFAIFLRSFSRPLSMRDTVGKNNELRMQLRALTYVNSFVRISQTTTFSDLHEHLRDSTNPNKPATMNVDEPSI